MLFNYVKLCLRLMARNPFNTFISVVGLTIGLISFYVLWFYASAQLNSDRYHTYSDRIVRICINWDWVDNGVEGHSVAGAPRSSVGPRILEDFPEVDDVVRILQQSGFNSEMTKHGINITFSTIGEANEKIFKETNVIYADDNLFRFFSIPLIAGDASTVLKEANSVVLSATTAKKYFGGTDAINKLLKLSDSVTLKVTGVFEDLPDNTHLGFDAVISNANHLNAWNTSFINFTNTYVKLKEGSLESFNDRLDKLNDRYWEDLSKHYWNVKVTMFTQPLVEISFSHSFVGDVFPPKSKAFLYTLGFISIAILFMAWANHVNLTVIRTVKRFKEIAARKISGAGKHDMLKQFMVESVLIYAVAVFMALTVIQLIKLPFQSTFNISIAKIYSLSVYAQLFVVGIILLGIVTSALYPVYSSSNLNPITLFSARVHSKDRKFFTTALTVTQFSAALIVIALGIVVARQLENVLMKTSDDDSVAVIIESPVHRSADYVSTATVFRNSLAAIPGIRKASAASNVVGDILGPPDFEIKRVGEEQNYGVLRSGVDQDFLSIFKFKLLAGRDFVPDDRKDVIIITKYASRRLGFSTPEDAIGSPVHVSLGAESRSWILAEVIGVVSDPDYGYHFKMDNVDDGENDMGMVFTYRDKLFSELIAERFAIQVHPSDVSAAIREAEERFTSMFPGNVFVSYFHDDLVNKIYTNEMIVRNQIILFTALSIAIACIGLLGIVSFEVVERKKEIGIRKVLGARLIQIGLLLVRSTGLQILGAVVISMPIAYYLAHVYLEKFSKQIELRWWHFATPVFILMVVLLSTVLSTIWKAARRNPVEALKHE